MASRIQFKAEVLIPLDQCGQGSPRRYEEMLVTIDVNDLGEVDVSTGYNTNPKYIDEVE